MPKEINVFALFNTLKRDGAVKLSDCEVEKVGESMDAVATEKEENDGDI